MTKKRKLIAAAAFIICTTANADITVKTGPELEGTEFKVEYGLISDLTKSRMERPAPEIITEKVTDGSFTIPTHAGGAAQYAVPVGERDYIMFYTQPGDNLTIDLTSVSPLIYTVSGSKLMDDISMLNSQSNNILQQVKQLSEAGMQPDRETLMKLQQEYDKIFKDYIAANPDAAAVPYALMNLEDEDFINYYTNLSEAAKKSPLMVFAENQKRYYDRKKAAEKRRAEMQSGTFPAPDFTFNNVDGQPVSLSDFRGKWVVIDFWGSWCRWCIKGFPELKKAYAEHQPELVVLGVACNDKYDVWKDALTRYELPWVNVYNPEDGGGELLTEYSVEGFPTKVIVNPEGIVKNITVGENPEFFDTLNELLKK